ncbi:hypothetical protein AVEN_264961-1 [Araneus ventricosus]|uniref:Uncharacterized protein n=1 Tax=Araneus ventricosus TaxID=182803 RepID=A0A4Y2UA93_ARAVE|nr:hypothetical protein AVEN_264961-1 [Araneus ventricosus]
MFFLPESTVPRRESVQYLPCQQQTAGQLHLVVIKETFSRLLWWGNSRTFPTIGVDHWEYGGLVVGRPGRQFSSRVKGRKSSLENSETSTWPLDKPWLRDQSVLGLIPIPQNLRHAPGLSKSDIERQKPSH